MKDEPAQLARIGSILAFLSVTIFAIGLLIQSTMDDASAAPIFITGGAGLTLLVAAAYLVLSARRPVSREEAARSAVAVLRRTAAVAAVLIVAGAVAALVGSASTMTAIILSLIALQSPIAMVMAAGYIQRPA